MATPIQLEYGINPQKGFVGALARDAEPFIIDELPAQVPTSGRNPRPGDLVYYDTTNKGVAVVTTADQQEIAVGIVTYFPGVVAKILSSVPSGANSASYVEYEDGQMTPFVRVGAVWLMSGAAFNYGDHISYDTSDNDWVAGTKPSSFATLVRSPVECIEREVASGAVFAGRIGVGRVF